jgi:hypothetical protein
MREEDPTRSEVLLAWAADVLAVLYFGWSYVGLSRHTTALGAIIQNLGAEVPGPTAFVMAHHGWLYPAVFGGATALLVAKEIRIRDKRLSVSVTFLTALVVLWMSDYFKSVLFLPLLDVIRALA